MIEHGADIAGAIFVLGLAVFVFAFGVALALEFAAWIGKKIDAR